MNYYERLRDLREDRDLKQIDVARVLNAVQQIRARRTNDGH